MEGRLLLKDCSLFRADGRVRSGMAVLVEGRTIAAIAPDEELPVRPGDWEVKCRGRLVAPGLVDAHTRLVGGLLAPLSGDQLLRGFQARAEAERTLEALLTVGEVEALTALSLARAVRAGVTMFVEHLHAPFIIEEALAVQARTASRIGARLLNSHASSSHTDKLAGPAQVAANASYAERQKDDPLVRGLIGVSESCTSDDDLLRAAGNAKEKLGLGAHFKLAASDDDLAMTWSRYNVRIVNRFEAFGLLGGASVAAHARAVDRNEVAKLARTRTLIALCPRTALTLEGGSALGMEAVLLGDNLVGLGTNGSSSLWDELAASFTGVMALARAGRMLDPDNLMARFLVGGPAELCTMIFGAPSGSVDVGALADLVVYDHVPPRAGGNFTPHLLMQLSQVQVGWTIINGRVVVREGQLLGCDFEQIASDARDALEAIWRRGGLATS